MTRVTETTIELNNIYYIQSINTSMSIKLGNNESWKYIPCTYKTICVDLLSQAKYIHEMGDSTKEMFSTYTFHFVSSI